MSLAAGLYGKLPARGDFVRQGFDDATVAALDGWLADGLAAWRGARDDDAFASAFAAAPHYTFYMPPDWAGAAALHGVLSPSVDKVGRYFFLVAGLGGDPAPAWHCAVNRPEVAAAAEAGVYAALGEAADPDTLFAALEAVAPADLDGLSWRAALATPNDAIFWTEASADAAPVVVRAAHPDAALVATLLDGGDA